MREREARRPVRPQPARVQGLPARAGSLLGGAARHVLVSDLREFEFEARDAADALQEEADEG
jgi:hypothetical protein